MKEEISVVNILNENRMLKSLKRWSFLHRAFYRLFLSVAPSILNNYFNFEYDGLENVDTTPEGTPVIFCANHRSHLDSIIFGCALAKPNWKRRYMAFMASGKAMKENPFFGLLHYLGAFPVFPENPEPALKYALYSLHLGLALYITPQGGRRARSTLGDYMNLHKEGRTGVGRLILKMNGIVPVIPVYIKGSAEALRVGQKVPKYKARVKIVFGKVMTFQQYCKEKGWDEDEEFYTITREIVNQIMCQIRGLLLSTEQYFLQFLEYSLGSSINFETLTDETIKRTEKIQRKLVGVPDSQLKRFLEAQKD
ncbi:MAG: lysophospholipid acyltransferase family protein [Promethearchaeota archaeon]